ncbi:hypothetical protein ASF31_05450 [Brevundimonas sp. Leaf280]|nr:hypothetical protein ASF31_05450 [Brevundimonas sp. Leaf280]
MADKDPAREMEIGQAAAHVLEHGLDIAIAFPRPVPEPCKIDCDSQYLIGKPVDHRVPIVAARAQRMKEDDSEAGVCGHAGAF